MCHNGPYCDYHQHFKNSHFIAAVLFSRITEAYLLNSAELNDFLFAEILPLITVILAYRPTAANNASKRRITNFTNLSAMSVSMYTAL